MHRGSDIGMAEHHEIETDLARILVHHLSLQLSLPDLRSLEHVSSAFRASVLAEPKLWLRAARYGSLLLAPLPREIGSAVALAECREACLRLPSHACTWRQSAFLRHDSACRRTLPEDLPLCCSTPPAAIPVQASHLARLHHKLCCGKSLPVTCAGSQSVHGWAWAAVNLQGTSWPIS